MRRTIGSVAVLSDVHGALPQLDAVLAEPEVRVAELIVVTGDHAAGPLPTEVLDRLTELGDRAVLVRGNADRELVRLARGAVDDGAPDVSVWAAGQLAARHVELLDGLPHPVVVTVEGFGDVLFCHGTPRDDDEVALVDSRLEWWREVLSDVDESVRAVVCGHTHMPFARLVDGRWVVNSGSVGMPYGSPPAPWALIDRSGIHLRWTRVDVDAAVRQIAETSGYPDVRAWIDEYLLHPPSDGDAIEAFGPRDGRTG
ncbi:metallophosphoesterase family protein [Xylanimonas sp. McL0601]|uniref:metallophosphoesterase family protein n=1 Tax=Xylanimonas sp. McL0601 TaxID=3414739 RepID=UPI003CF2D35F